MKKIILGALLLSAGTLSAQAQISAGTKLLSGSIGYNKDKQETTISSPGSRNVGTETSQFNFNPSVGYFVADNLALGVSAGVLANKGKEQRNSNNNTYSELESKSRVLSAGVFGRYYKFVGDKVAVYGQLGGGYTNYYVSGSTANGLPVSDSNRLQGFYANLLPGIVFFPTEKLGIELTLRGASYNRLTDEDDFGTVKVKSTASNFDFGFGLDDVNLGISLYLGRN